MRAEDRLLCTETEETEEVLKAVIVDDEYLVRERLKQGFDWDDLGFEIAGEAATGHQALEVIESEKPDLAIIDIVMPDMDGLQLVKKLRKTHPKIKVIILTGFSRFEYAREALHERVYHFLLKPIDEEEFGRAIEQIAEEIRNEQKREETEKRDANEILRANTILRENFIGDFFTGRIGTENENRETLTERFSRYGIKTGNSNTVILLRCRLRDYLWDEYEIGLKKFAIYNTFQSYADKGTTIVAAVTPEGNIFLIFDNEADGSDETEAFYTGPVTFAEDVSESLESAIGLSVTAGIGTPHTGIEGLVQSYREAYTALMSRLTFPDKKIIPYSNIEQYGEATTQIDLEQMIQILVLMRSGNSEEIRKTVHEFFERIREQKVLIGELRRVVSMLINTAREFAVENSINIHDFIGRFFNVDGFLEDTDTLEEVEEWCVKILENLISRRKATPAGKTPNIVGKIQEYVDKNYSDHDIGLEQIATRLFVSPSYISSTFKKYTQLSVTQYLTRVRMEKARELLDSEDKSIGEIADRVGFNDVYYFSRSFKKFYGIPPSRYVRTQK